MPGKFLKYSWFKYLNCDAPQERIRYRNQFFSSSFSIEKKMPQSTRTDKPLNHATDLQSRPDLIEKYSISTDLHLDIPVVCQKEHNDCSTDNKAIFTTRGVTLFDLR